MRRRRVASVGPTVPDQLTRTESRALETQSSWNPVRLRWREAGCSGRGRAGSGPTTTSGAEVRRKGQRCGTASQVCGSRQSISGHGRS